MLKRPHVAVSPDKRLFVRDRGFEGIAFWHLGAERSEPVLVSELFHSAVAGIGFEPSGRLVTVTRDAELWVWDVDQLANWDNWDAEPDERAVVPVDEANQDGESDGGESDESAEETPLEPAAPREPVEKWHVRLPLRSVVATAFSDDRRYLIAGDEDGAIALVDLADEEPIIARRVAHDDHVVALAFDRTGARFASSGRDRKIKFWGTDLTESAPQSATGSAASDPAPVPAPTAPTAPTVPGETPKADPLDPEAAVKQVDPASGEGAVAADEDGVTEEDVLDFFSDVPEASDETSEKEDVPEQSGSEDEAPALLQESSAPGLTFPALYQTVETEGWAIALAWDASGHRLAVGAMDNGLYLFDVGEETGLSAVRFVHSGWVSDVEWGPSDAVIMTSSWDTTVGLFTPEELTPELAFELHQDYVVDVTFVPGTDLVVSASYDRTAVVWDWKERVAVTRLTGHSDWVDFALNLDDGRLLTVCADGTNRIWNTADWSCTNVLGISVSAGFEVGAPVDLSEYVDLSGLASRALDKPRQESSEPATRYRDMRASSFGAGSGQTAMSLLTTALEDAPDVAAFASSAPNVDAAAQFDPAIPEVDLPEPDTASFEPDLSDSMGAKADEAGVDTGARLPDSEGVRDVPDAPDSADAFDEMDRSGQAETADAAAAFEARDLGAEAEDAPQLVVEEPKIDLPDASITADLEPSEPERATPKPLSDEPLSSEPADVESSPLGDAALPDIEFKASTEKLDDPTATPEPDIAAVPVETAEPTDDRADQDARVHQSAQDVRVDHADPDARTDQDDQDDEPSTLEMTRGMLQDLDDDSDVGTMRGAPSVAFEEEVEEEESPTMDGGPRADDGGMPEIDENWERLESDLLTIEEASVFGIEPAVDMIKGHDESTTSASDPRAPLETDDVPSMLNAETKGDETKGSETTAAVPTERGRPAVEEDDFTPAFHEASDAEVDDWDDDGAAELGAGGTVGFAPGRDENPPDAIASQESNPRQTQELPEAPGRPVDPDANERARRHRSKTAAGQDLSEESTFRFFFDGESGEEEEEELDVDSGATSRLVPDRGNEPGFASSPEVFDTSVSEIWQARPDQSEVKMGIVKKPRDDRREYRSAYAIRTYHQWVYSVAISSDGESIASCGGNDLVCVWSKVGDLLHQLRAPSSGFNEVKFTPDGTVVVAAGDDGGIHMWMLPQGEYSRIRHAVLDGHDAVVSAIAFTPDGRYMLSGSFDGTARVWDMTDGKCRVVLDEHDGPIADVAIAGRRAFTVGHDGTVRIWDDRKWLAVDVFDGFDKLLSVSSNGVIHAWTAANGDAFYAEDARAHGLLQHRGEARGVCVTESGIVVTAGQDSQIRIYQRGETAPAQSLQAPASLWSLDVRDGFIAAGGDDGRIHVFRP